MRNESRLVTSRSRVFPLVLLLVASILTVSAKPEKRAANVAQARKQAVVFSVSADSGEGRMDVVVIVDGKQLRAPYTDEQKDKQKDFGKQYFAPGKVYRLIFGGGEAGTVTLKKWSEGCNNIHAEVTPATSAKLGGRVMALATNSETLGKRASARRAPTEVERAAVMTLVKSIYSQNRTPANLMAAIKVTNLTATDLDGDGKYEFIGSFTSAAKNKFERD
ncbi:MAG: hypothetical protein AABM67_17800, partial [Acidobacteriota bacterium]